MSTPVMESFQGPSDKNYEAVYAMAESVSGENEQKDTARTMESLKEAQAEHAALAAKQS